MKTTVAKKFLLDAAMRKGLMELLWSFRMDAESKYLSVAQPLPMNMDDEQIKKELKRIIGFK